MSNNQRITELEAKLSQLQQELDELKNSPKEWPQVGDKYYTVYMNGGIISYEFDYSSEVHKFHKNIGNMFQTREEAEAELHARLTIAKLRSQPGRKKFVVDQINWCVGDVDFRYTVVTPDCWSNFDKGFASTYFESSESVENAIKAVGANNILKAARWLAMGETG